MPHGDLLEKEFELKERDLFYQNIAKRAEIYDPLDRSILNNENKIQNIRTHDLKNRIVYNTPKLHNEISSKLNVPLSTSEYEQLKDKFENEIYMVRFYANDDMAKADKCLLNFDYDFTQNDYV